MARNVGQLMLSLCVPFQHQKSSTQLILIQTPPTPEVGYSEICHKFHGSLPWLWSREELGKETWQSVKVVICKVFQQVTRLFEETDYVTTLLSSPAT